MTGPNIRILVVDDEPAIRKLLRVGLGAEGYDIVEAPNAREALALVASLAACGMTDRQMDHDRRYLVEPRVSQAALHPNETPELRRLIQKYSAMYDVPESLVHRVVIRESRHLSLIHI